MYPTHDCPSRLDVSLTCLRYILMLSVICLISLGSLRYGGAQKPAAKPVGVDYEQLKNQGITYFNNDLFERARIQFDKAYDTPEGKGDFVVVYYRGFLAEQELHLEVAFEMAELAVKLGQNEEEQSQAQQLLDQLKGRFSYVKISPAAEETNRKGRIYLETKRRILNKQKREQFESIRLRFRSMDVEVPTKIYLPYGRYTANNVPFEIKRNSEEIPDVSLFLHIIKAEGEGEGGNAWLYTGIGVTGAAILGVGAYLLFKPETTFENQTRFSFAE